MSPRTIHLYVPCPAKPRGEAWAERIGSEAGDTVRVVLVEAASLCAESLTKGAAHILWWDGEMAPEILHEFSDHCDELMKTGLVIAERPLPVMALSVPWVGAEESVSGVWSRLEGMMLRQGEIDRLRHELAISTRCTGGLRGEISRMHDELQLAAMVQQEFLPRELPEVLGVRFAALWQPASYVSGDIYDVIRLDDEHVGLFLADAVGHGVPAALLTMVICRSLPTREVKDGHARIVPPSEALARLNTEMIRRQGRTTRFATAVYGVLNCRSRVLTLAGAGHPVPFVLRADGRTDALETPGGLLGVFAEESFEQIEIELGVCDRLVMYSDGFEVAFPDGKTEGSSSKLPTRRYLEEFERLRLESDPQRAIEVIRETVGRQQGSLHQVDDLTLLCTDIGPTPVRFDSARESVAAVSR